MRFSVSEITTQSKRSTAFALRFAVTPVAGEGSSPKFRHYVLKVLPALVKGRAFQLPLRLFDGMMSNGIEVSRPGRAIEDLEFLERLEDNADTVAYEDIATRIGGVSRSFDVVIQSIQMQVAKVPELARGYGGICIVTLRTAD